MASLTIRYIQRPGTEVSAQDRAHADRAWRCHEAVCPTSNITITEFWTAKTNTTTVITTYRRKTGWTCYIERRPTRAIGGAQ